MKKSLLVAIFFYLLSFSLVQAESKIQLTKNQNKELDRRITEVSSICHHMKSNVVVGDLEEHENTFCKNVSCVMSDDKLAGALAVQEACVDKIKKK